MVLSPLTTLALGVAMGLCGAYWVGRHYRQRMAILLLEMEDLETQARNARSTRDAVGQVIGSMTQRVLGPIQNIVTWGRVLEQSATATGAQRDLARAVSDSGQQLEQVLGDALGVSLSTTGSLELEESEVDVRALMAAVARSVRSRCVRAQVEFALLLGPDLPRKVVTDGIKLRYLLQHMINEVIGTTDAGGYVTLSAARWLTPTPGDDGVRLYFEACGGVQAPSVEPGSPRARKVADLASEAVAAEEGAGLTLAEQFATVLGGSVVALEGAQGGINMHAEVSVGTTEEAIAEIIEIQDYQQPVAVESGDGFFGFPATEEDRLVDLVLLDRPAQ